MTSTDEPQTPLKNEWGLPFYGRAKRIGTIWYYEERSDGGTIKKIPLIPNLPNLIEKHDTAPIPLRPHRPWPLSSRGG